MINLNLIERIKNNYIIKKNNKEFNLTEKPNINFFKNNKPIYNKVFNRYVYNFITTISQNHNIDLSLFYENLKTLDIFEKKNFNNSSKSNLTTRGNYYPYDNTIAVKRNDDFYSIFHELLHVASTRRSKDKFSCGFNTVIYEETEGYNLIKGLGLTEGYTTLLANRYFGSISHKEETGYSTEEFIASMLEKIVDKDRLENFYFNADLNGLINYLEQFAHLYDISLFLYHYDMYLKATSNTGIEKRIKFMGCFLFNTYMNKLLSLLKNQIITDDEFDKLLNEFFAELKNTCIERNNDCYEFLNNDWADHMWNEFTKNINESKIKRLSLP